MTTAVSNVPSAESTNNVRRNIDAISIPAGSGTSDGLIVGPVVLAVKKFAGKFGDLVYSILARSGGRAKNCLTRRRGVRGGISRYFSFSAYSAPPRA